MNLFFQKPYRPVGAPLIFFILICCCGLLLSAPANCENSVAEEIITLEIKNQPLGDVLEDISAETGYEFSLDENWLHFPVTASIRNQPLHIGLKRILRNFNSAVIYGSDGVIKIKIYDRETSSGQAAGQSTANRTYEEPGYQPVISSNPRTVTPGSQAGQRRWLPQTDENAAEESSESEPNPAEADDNKEEEEEPSGTADEEAPDDSESESAEDTSEEGGPEAAETDAPSETAPETGAAENQ